VQIREALAQSLAAPREQVRLEPPALGRDSALFGAAEVAFAPLVDDPLGHMTSARTRAAR
jgi:hypothetical protein